MTKTLKGVLVSLVAVAMFAAVNVHAQAIKSNVLNIPLTMNSSESITLTTSTSSYVVPPDGTFSGTPIQFSTNYNLAAGRTVAGAAYFASGSALTSGSTVIPTSQITEQSTTNNLTGTGGSGVCTVNNAWFSANACPMIFQQAFTGAATGVEQSTIGLAFSGTIPPAAGSYTGSLFISVVAN